MRNWKEKGGLGPVPDIANLAWLPVTDYNDSSADSISTGTGHHSLEIKLQTDHTGTSQCVIPTYHLWALEDQAPNVYMGILSTARNQLHLLGSHMAQTRITEAVLGPHSQQSSHQIKVLCMDSHPAQSVPVCRGHHHRTWYANTLSKKQSH